MAEASAEKERRELGGLPVVTAEETLSLDDRLGKNGIRLEAVVSRVGYVTAQVILKEILPDRNKAPEDAVVTLLIGTGNKGAAALACGRTLADAGVTVNVVLARQKKEYKGIPKEMLDKVEDHKNTKKVYSGWNERAFEQADVLVDGLIGVGLKGAPRASVSLLVKGANFSMKPTVAMDLPSGLDATTGVQSPVTIKAAATVIVALPKRGMLGASNLATCGDLYLADANIPTNVMSEHLGTEVPDLLQGKEYVRLEVGEPDPATEGSTGGRAGTANAPPRATANR